RRGNGHFGAALGSAESLVVRLARPATRLCLQRGQSWRASGWVLEELAVDDGTIRSPADRNGARRTWHAGNAGGRLQGGGRLFRRGHLLRGRLRRLAFARRGVSA